MNIRRSSQTEHYSIYYTGVLIISNILYSQLGYPPAEFTVGSTDFFFQLIKINLSRNPKQLYEILKKFFQSQHLFTNDTRLTTS